PRCRPRQAVGDGRPGEGFRCRSDPEGRPDPGAGIPVTGKGRRDPGAEEKVAQMPIGLAQYPDGPKDPEGTGHLGGAPDLSLLSGSYPPVLQEICQVREVSSLKPYREGSVLAGYYGLRDFKVHFVPIEEFLNWWIFLRCNADRKV
ncbi:hypothetical protein chiPu_0022962, partial [Chiloscyllium punctatum]|nr:hypothetical protein [Chiloscyllium punctatum]